MNERRTISMLQRVPIILAVTAASYGLPLQSQAHAQRGAGEGKKISKPAAALQARGAHDRRLARVG